MMKSVSLHPDETANIVRMDDKTLKKQRISRTDLFRKDTDVNTEMVKSCQLSFVKIKIGFVIFAHYI